MSTETTANVSVTVAISEGGHVSDEIATALNNLAMAIAGDEIAEHLEGHEDDVSGFAFATPSTSRPMLIPPGPSNFCINKTTGAGTDGHCTINTDGDTDSCTVDVW